ncbi:MAG: hypothetical protein MJD61_04910, partial [Proteobacteria bacterium]|nr:hypothetical protein [Pseudomonadota bacterium]
ASDPNRPKTRLGYTGHEHFNKLGLVNMKGRIYDAHMGRFLTPDPFVPEPGNSQSWNRYSYVGNNPLNWVDPSGFTPCESDPEKCVKQRDGGGGGGGAGSVDVAVIEHSGWVYVGETQRSDGGGLQPTYGSTGSGSGANDPPGGINSGAPIGFSGTFGDGGYAEPGDGPNTGKAPILGEVPGGGDRFDPAQANMVKPAVEIAKKLANLLVPYLKRLKEQATKVISKQAKAIRDAIRTAREAGDKGAARGIGLGIRNTSTVVRTASEAYKGTTRVGHALSKHAGRRSDIWGKVTGNQSTWHGQGMKHFRDIMRGPGSFQRVTNSQGTTFLEKRLADGRGMRLQFDYRFKGFID